MLSNLHVHKKKNYSGRLFGPKKSNADLKGKKVIVALKSRNNL